ncbi:MAG: hypothetical protein K0U52_09850 [Gammaproteobacteria bacterium]|nr:hypothetical protein [Gammaproteobacteria bacterium]
MFDTIKKRLYPFSLTILTLGASLILGLLSFGGMYALWPALVPSLLSFALSVAYEGEIYRQNIDRAFEKIFKKNYFEHQLTKEFLNTHFQDTNGLSLQLSTFYSRYHSALVYNNTDVLDEMEATFSAQLRAECYDEEASDDLHAKALYDWLHAPQPNNAPSLHEQYKARYENRRRPLFAIQLFSLATSAFMGLGTTYLLVELFTLIPMLATIPTVAWPFIITPMAGVAGLAYGLLTYNAVTNLMANDTILTWYRKLRNNLQDNPYSPKHIGMALTASLLFTMAIALTVCTAGTWWTIAQEVPPLFNWMRRLPTAVMGVVNPILIGLSSVVFNFENTSETLTMIEELTDENNQDLSIQPIKDAFKNMLKHLWEKENVLQWLNPFRLALVLVILPLRYVLFIGHLVSIGVTADRIPGFSKYLSAFIGSISEGFEDVHYFFKHTHATDLKSRLNERLGESQGHEHNEDIPSWLIGKIAQPFYLCSAMWDSVSSLFNTKEYRVSVKQSYTQQYQSTAPADSCCSGVNCEHNMVNMTTLTNINIPPITSTTAETTPTTSPEAPKGSVFPCGLCNVDRPPSAEAWHAFRFQPEAQQSSDATFTIATEDPALPRP